MWAELQSRVSTTHEFWDTLYVYGILRHSMLLGATAVVVSDDVVFPI
jgi:hypothetical protein